MIIDVPLELKQLNEALAMVIASTGQQMCSRLAKQAETARKKVLRTGSRRDLAAWVARSTQAESAHLTFKQWQEGKL